MLSYNLESILYFNHHICRLFKRWCSLVTTREAISSTTRQSMSSIPMNPVNIPTRNTYMTQFPSYMQVASHNPRESMTGRNDSISQPAVLSSSATIKDTSANKVEPKMYPDNDTMNGKDPSRYELYGYLTPCPRVCRFDCSQVTVLASIC